MMDIERIGGEILLKSAASLAQFRAALVHLDGGGYAVVYENVHQVGATTRIDIRGIIFDKNGQFVGDELILAASETDDGVGGLIDHGNQSGAALAATDDGGFVMVSIDPNSSTFLSDLEFLTVGPTGFFGEPLIIASDAGSSFSDPTVAALSDGSVAVGSVRETFPASGGFSVNIDTRIVTDGGLVIENSLEINAPGQQQGPSVAAGDDSEFMLVFTDFNDGDPADDAPRVGGAVLDASLTIPSGFDLAKGTVGVQQGGSVASLAGGGFISIWGDLAPSGADSIEGRLFNRKGKPLGPDFSIASGPGVQENAFVAAAPDGSFAAFWEDNGLVEREIVGQHFAADGTKLGGPFRVNLTSAGSQEGVVAAFGDSGRLMVAWTHVPEGGAAEIRAQLFQLPVVVHGTGGNDTLNGTAGANVMLGGNGNDRLKALAGDDDIFGADGRDRLDGGRGNDLLDGGDGNDLLIGGGGADKLRGGKRIDTASYENTTGGVSANLRNAKANKGEAKGDTYSGIENLNGSKKGDVLTGNDGANLIQGLGGNDKLNGGKGADRLEGGLGADTLAGGGGADGFVFRSITDSPNKKKRWDVVADFSRKQKDKIDLSGIDAKTGPKNQAFTFIGDDAFSGGKGELRYDRLAKKTFVYGDVNGDAKADFRIELAKAIDLKDGDFVL